jgi:hypothetical protein
MIVMQSMELDDEDKLDAIMPMPMADKPDYPYGLRICLTEKELEKLGIDASDAVDGGICHGHFMARITCVSAEQRDGKQCCRIEMQIEELAIESEDAENEGK